MALKLDADALQKVISSFVGKDKILRLVQYLCRFNKGVLQQGILGLESGELKFVMEKNWDLFKCLMNSRRTFRLLNSLGTLIKLRDGIKTKPWGDKLHPLYLLSTYLMALWPAIDHYRFLILIKWATGNSQAEVRNFSYRLFAFAQVVTCLAMAHRGYLSDEAETKAGKTARWNCTKAGLTALTIGHVSQFPGLTTNELICGGTGVLSSAMDLYKMWPRHQADHKKGGTSAGDDDGKHSRFVGLSTAVLLATLGSVSLIRGGIMK
mmetsp:Transcript_31880/g.55998  ORF Transcript_31880/g.55998 Transcript_31880/m.55998 type:complete len:265 (-) Transcript_31880:219-1013(-)|eukprot:CAMPEP_0197518468 /NCGR_PEP_ID=MMETSP1318-20131121/3674_1 /TAXON_ID=552666 /ORGANISM="Partenskyella glossopodia, Strain RCC365" /LENGTH=264 /DNA_ID=CAMNT_0043068837 /DNA_START=150 /DNA_END=944 /DNA_ORIENTATION=+